MDICKGCIHAEVCKHKECVESYLEEHKTIVLLPYPLKEEIGCEVREAMQANQGPSKWKLQRGSTTSDTTAELFDWVVSN